MIVADLRISTFKCKYTKKKHPLQVFGGGCFSLIVIVKRLIDKTDTKDAQKKS